MADDEQLSEGGDLRKKLEAALEANKLLNKQLATMKAGDLLRSPEFGLVKPDDLKDVELENLEPKAKQLQAERAEVIRAVLAMQGVEGDELETQVQNLITGKATKLPGEEETEIPDAAETLRQLGTITGEPVSKAIPSELEGEKAMEFSLAKSAAGK